MESSGIRILSKMVLSVRFSGALLTAFGRWSTVVFNCAIFGQCKQKLLSAAIVSAAGLSPFSSPAAACMDGRVRVATFNSSLSRPVAGEMKKLLASGNHPVAHNVAQAIRAVAADIIVLQEFDYSDDGSALDLFAERYLAKPQGGDRYPPVFYRYRHQVSSNTGLLAAVDIDGDGEIKPPNDAYGFGMHPGHFAFALLSRFPIDRAAIRSFQRLKWRDMPAAKLPIIAGKHFYPELVRDELRLSSKNHVDLPVRIGQRRLHIVAAHPTPPVFDGPEDRNGRRNFDEIRLLREYLDGASWLRDDRGKQVTSSAANREDESFVVLGDLNAAPVGGSSMQGAIEQLLLHPSINRQVAVGTRVPASEGGKEIHNQSATATFGGGLRVDYVLPGSALDVQATGVFWPAPGKPGSELFRTRETSSDHRPVWADICMPVF